MTRNSRKLEVIMLSFVVLVPFIVVMLMTYIVRTTPQYSWKNIGLADSDESEVFLESEPYCDDTRIVGLVQKIYPDDKSFNVKLKCTGLIFSDNIAILLAECFKNEYDTVPIKSLHFVTSGSRYWSKDRNIHKIIKWRILNSKDDSPNNSSIIIIEVDPEFPQPCDEKQDSFLVEEKYDQKVEHKLIGWSAASKTANVEFMQITFKEVCTEYAPSAVVFSQYGSTSGFQSTTCTEQSSFDDTLIPLSFYIEKLAAEYANIDVTKVERSKRQVNGHRVNVSSFPQC